MWRLTSGSILCTGGNAIRVPKEIEVVVESMLEKKAEEVSILDVRDLTSFTDYFVLCNGESEPQLRTISKNIEEKMKEAGLRPHHLEGKSENGWILMDYDDFVVHIFSPDKRSFYDLEGLWADAPRIPVSNGAPVRAAR